MNPQNINFVKANFPAGALQASGISVGLPWGEEGNSEVGHLTIGAGRTVYQHYPRITLSIKDKSFFKNESLKNAFSHAKKNNSAINLIGLLSASNIHSSLEHLLALIRFAKNENVSKLNLHLFSDGRDSPPRSALNLLSRIPREKLASISGRFFAMNRDQHWDRTERAYNVLTGDGSITENLEAHINETYSRNLNDEYIEPILAGPEKRFVKDGDAVIIFDFREDGIRQIASPFALKNFDKFPVKNFKNLYVATMTQYDDKFSVPVAFPRETVENPLGKIISDLGKNQLRIAETQKYHHITYFFNGMREEPFKNEYRILIPSRPILKQDDEPQMMAPEITNRLIESMNEGVFDFILVNFANADMIAHTGNYEACLKAVKIIDEIIGKIVDVCLNTNAILIITSDHGNMERVINPQTGAPETQHDPSPVPIYLVAKELKRRKDAREIRESERGAIGVLADVAPTILELMGIKKPKEMTGQGLVRLLR